MSRTNSALNRIGAISRHVTPSGHVASQDTAQRHVTPQNTAMASQASQVWIKAPVSGEVVTTCVKVGDVVTATSPIGVVLSMKMERELPVSVAGTVVATSPCLTVGKSVNEGEPLVLVELARDAGTTAARKRAPRAAHNADEVRPELAEVLQRRLMTQDRWRAEHDQKFARRRHERHARGQLTARETVDSLADRTWSEMAGLGSSFRELGRFVVAAQLGRRKKEDLIQSTPAGHVPNCNHNRTPNPNP